MGQITETRKNVYQALQERIAAVFSAYDYVYVAFSGGKDSSIVLNACIDFLRQHKNTGTKLGVFHLDYEIQYALTTEYIDRTLASNRDLLEVYRCCVPFKVPSSTSMYQRFWRPWDPKIPDWVRPMPTECLNAEDFNFYTTQLWDYEFQQYFAHWLRFKKKVRRIACLIGIRTQESFNRWRLIYHPTDRHMPLRRAQWIHETGEGIYNIYPIYDWKTTDIWIANGRFGWDYNRLYDLYHQAGVPLNKQRVASPFISQAISSLHLYRAIDPDMWGKMLCRVNGVNFAGIYGHTSAMGWRSARLPEGMTWKQYLYFLLDTLPKETRENYLRVLSVSKRFWKTKGGCLSTDTIRKLREKEIELHVSSTSNYNTDKMPVMMDYMDDIDLPEFRELPTYKRMCICVLKNDHYCKYMGFTPGKREQERRKKIMDEYSSYLETQKRRKKQP
ncbi:MAG: phosphoadenosine phosphosulfate sulfurtransferase [Paludibacter sp. 47-17]|nr:MAG: phosphoadenosine phosphosulfate sulfurtransferase [Paludibacter sp. 47-17]